MNLQDLIDGKISQEELKSSILEEVSVKGTKATTVMGALINESDRGVALAGLAFFDKALEELLLEYFRFGVGRFGYVRTTESVEKSAKQLFQFGNMGSFNIKLNLAHAIGLLEEETLENLKMANRIRNRFAHDLEVSSFDNPVIIQLVSNLKTDFEPEDSESLREANKHRFVYALGAAFTLVIGMTAMLQRGLPIHLVMMSESEPE